MYFFFFVTLGFTHALRGAKRADGTAGRQGARYTHSRETPPPCLFPLSLRAVPCTTNLVFMSSLLLL